MNTFHLVPYTNHRDRHRNNPDIHITLTSIRCVATAKQAIHLRTIGCAKQEMAFQKLNSTLNSIYVYAVYERHSPLDNISWSYCLCLYHLRIELIPVEIRCILYALHQYSRCYVMKRSSSTFGMWTSNQLINPKRTAIDSYHNLSSPKEYVNYILHIKQMNNRPGISAM